MLETISNLENQPGASPDILGAVCAQKFINCPEHVSTYCTVTGQIFEALELGTTYLRREMRPDGTRGAPYIDYQRTRGAKNWNEAITVNNKGEWIYVFGDEDVGGIHEAGDKIRPFKKAIIATKILAGRPKKSA
ncbi:MAG: hypothetical protein JWO35_418 [Candidatus Saccharibacteria bacterium]|nr:hypothetical protein [Candidatus Saccharibacteria bacterium]